ncbi:MAG: hypothetical protein M3O29_00120, partial [Actinomycetota bacterium]|nr:hypothetical protein [Actinomycetota bacterium]
MRRGVVAVFAAVLALVFVLGATGMAGAGPARIFPEALQGRAALEALGDRLPAVAAAQGSTASELGRILRTDRTAWLDRDARLFYVERAASGTEPSSDASVANAPATAEPYGYTATGVPIFHSLPGAMNVLYLDFDGETISGTAWNVGTVDPLEAVPFDRDGDVTTFSDDERSHITGTWLRVAEDYAPFAVDVTTEEPAAFGPTTGRVLITSNTDANGNPMPYPDAGGVAYVGVFGRADYPTYYSPALVYADQLFSAEYNIAEAASHEFGHNVGLHHDGTSTAAYYYGAGTSTQATSWAPIMGVGYYKNVTKFNNGDYPDANNHEDDLTIVGSKLGRVADDVGATQGTAAGLTVTASTVAGAGLVNDSTDQDTWGFQTTGGTVSLSVSPFVRGYGTSGGNLDVKATLVDAAG